MNDTVSLTIKIDPALKEMLKSFALENQITLSQEVSQRLQDSLNTFQHPAVDNQGVIEDVDAPLSLDEIKKVRALLKKTKKKK
ncbi:MULTISPECIES: TraY domain-containing protein [Erwinia]|uniref:TraY domain-containing protein n=1 Tax=Erwinia TaxID=551 RepID=UPI000553C31D|nr:MULTISPECIES: TraY domain-containing protein [Erwinia]